MDSLEETRFPVTWSLEELILATKPHGCHLWSMGTGKHTPKYSHIYIIYIYINFVGNLLWFSRNSLKKTWQKNTHQIHINHKPDAASRQEEHRTKSQCVPQSQPRDRHVSRDLNLKNHFSAFVLVSIKSHWSFISGNNKCPQGAIIHHSSSIIIHHPCTR